MRAPFRPCLPLALLLLAACSPKTDGQGAVPAPESAPTPAPVAAPAAEPAPVAIAQEAEQKCTNEPRTDENDTRPRCGGPALQHAAGKRSYRITLDNGEFFQACDITKPFSGKIGRGMVTMSFKPDDHDEKNGTVAWHFSGGGGMADTAYDYALSGPEEKMTGSFVANAAICGKAAGLGACAAARKKTFTSTWTRIEDCDK